MSPLVRQQFHDEKPPVSLAASEPSAPGLNRILPGFDEVDVQLQDMLIQRGRELDDAVGSPEEPAGLKNIAVAV